MHGTHPSNLFHVLMHACIQAAQPRNSSRQGRETASGRSGSLVTRMHRHILRLASRGGPFFCRRGMDDALVPLLSSSSSSTSPSSSTHPSHRAMYLDASKQFVCTCMCAGAYTVGYVRCFLHQALLELRDWKLRLDPERAGTHGWELLWRGLGLGVGAGLDWTGKVPVEEWALG